MVSVARRPMDLSMRALMSENVVSDGLMALSEVEMKGGDDESMVDPALPDQGGDAAKG